MMPARWRSPPLLKQGELGLVPSLMLARPPDVLRLLMVSEPHEKEKALCHSLSPMLGTRE